ncbi:hypothetical protein [Carboxydothermus pertinax]|uniref:Potassium transporter Kef n=1 Tax=Carboxydothermus pertinax TaxID=870242 RepID=A0A1L8CWM1_9THEO|nr:hypothetical protein [Carboxydothermus pertinax]GAV23281.1 potassium transporter Kef [Carboxydothermus pertinax]
MAGFSFSKRLLAGWAGISNYLVLIAVGVVAGNFLGLLTTLLADFLAGLDSILQTFLAEAEVNLWC